MTLRHLLCLVAMVALGCLWPPLAFGEPASPEHPRLLFGAKDVPALRQKITREPFKSMVAVLKADLDKNNWAAEPADPDEEWDSATCAQRYALMYVLTGEDAYAQKARAHVQRVLAAKGFGKARDFGLSMSYYCTYLACAYDWCHGAPSWDAAFTSTLAAKLKQEADLNFENGGSSQNLSISSNWQALRFSSSGLAYLALDGGVDPERVEACTAKVSDYLSANLGSGKNNAGWNAEGLGYTFYPMANGVCPFAIALNRHDPGKDLRKVTAASYTLWTPSAVLVASSDSPEGLFRPDFGDDNPGAVGEGCYGFAFWFCPQQLQPGLKWVYDRTVGAKGTKTFDHARFGIIASLLYYPADLAEKDPMSIPEWRKGFVDTDGNGYFTYRNHYRGDASDIVVQLYGKFRGDLGHHGPDALSFRMAGLDTLLAAGGGRYGPKTDGQDVYLRSMNTLYPVDPDAKLSITDGKGRLVGTPVLHDDGSGHVVLHAPRTNLSVARHTRRFLTTFPSQSSAAVVICDTSDDGKYWQLCTLETNKITTGSNTFTITNRSGSTVVGTVLYPTGNIDFRTGTRPRGSDAGKIKNNHFIHFQSPDGCYLVILALQPKGQGPPQVSASGTWGPKPSGVVHLGNKAIKIEGDTIGVSD